MDTHSRPSGRFAKTFRLALVWSREAASGRTTGADAPPTVRDHRDLTTSRIHRGVDLVELIAQLSAHRVARQGLRADRHGFRLSVAEGSNFGSEHRGGGGGWCAVGLDGPPRLRHCSDHPSLPGQTAAAPPVTWQAFESVRADKHVWLSAAAKRETWAVEGRAQPWRSTAIPRPVSLAQSTAEPARRSCCDNGKFQGTSRRDKSTSGRGEGSQQPEPLTVRGTAARAALHPGSGPSRTAPATPPGSRSPGWPTTAARPSAAHAARS